MAIDAGKVVATLELETRAFSGGVNTALCDGSVRFVSETIELEVWRALGSTKGGETRASL